MGTSAERDWPAANGRASTAAPAHCFDELYVRTSDFTAEDVGYGNLRFVPALTRRVLARFGVRGCGRHCAESVRSFTAVFRAVPPRGSARVQARVPAGEVVLYTRGDAPRRHLIIPRTPGGAVRSAEGQLEWAGRELGVTRVLTHMPRAVTEQLALYLSARTWIGAHGSNNVHAVFMRPGTTCAAPFPLAPLSPVATPVPPRAHHAPRPHPMVAGTSSCSHGAPICASKAATRIPGRVPPAPWGESRTHWACRHSTVAYL